MTLILLLVLLALLLGGVGLAVEGLKWLIIIIAVILLVVSLISGGRSRL